MVLCEKEVLFSTFNIDKNNISSTKIPKVVGITFDDQLILNKHVSKFCKRV